MARSIHVIKFSTTNVTARGSWTRGLVGEWRPPHARGPRFDKRPGKLPPNIHRRRAAGLPASSLPVVMPAEEGYTAEAACAMLTFSLASSSLLLINKLTLHYLPVPALVSTLQFVSASVTSVVLMASGAVAVDRFEWRKVKPYLLYVFMFVATIYANMRALQHSNVETIIVFRACCPLIVCVLDWACLGRHLPSLRSVLALLVVASGCAGYVLTDRAFKLSGWGAYTWVTAYFFIISFEMAYGKHIVGPHLNFASMWGPTLYTNTISVPPMLSIGFLTHEIDRLAGAQWNTISISLLLLSCVIGVAISYLGWKARSLVTATCYTLLGVANKMLTVLANAMVWDNRASLNGMFFLCICLVGAAGYKQAPLAEAGEAAPCSGKSGAKCRSRSAIYVGLFIAAGATVGMFLSASAAPLPPSPSPMQLVPPSAAPSIAVPPGTTNGMVHVPAPLPSRGGKGLAADGKGKGLAAGHATGHAAGHAAGHRHTHHHTSRNASSTKPMKHITSAPGAKRALPSVGNRRPTPT